jgi:RimJ/RimL family protein N-acetyltransferase
MRTDEAPSAFLETRRLARREMVPDDVDNLMLIFSDPGAMRYYPSTKTRQEAERWIRWVTESYEEDGFGLWVWELKETGEFAGQCGLMAQEVEGRREVEVGYLFVRKLWGRGLATEAARASRDWGFEQLGRRRLVSLINPSNVPSRRVAEKIGMTLEKEFEWHGRPTYVYSVTR